MAQDNRIYVAAFLISLIAHGFVLFQVSGLSNLVGSNRAQKIEVSYIRASENLANLGGAKSLAREPFLKLPSKITGEGRNPPPFMDSGDILRQANRDILSDSDITKPTVMKPYTAAIKRKITLPALDVNKSNNPSYISYYQLVREKIRRAAYQNYSRTETGEVYLSFIISEDGSLKEVRLVDEKSSDSRYLREIALRSIKEASPFPGFPKDLDYPQLSFNVVISFEIEQ